MNSSRRRISILVAFAAAALAFLAITSPSQASYAVQKAVSITKSTLMHLCERFCGNHHHHHGHRWCDGHADYWCPGH